ncbi:MAG: glycogen debranching enzyme GlgX, partial [Burkholderiales bacterium]
MSMVSSTSSSPAVTGLPPGRPYPLGASLRDGGVNFAVFAEDANAMELCVFDARGHEARHPLTHCDDGVWHGFLAGAAAGLVYGYRAHGHYAPDQGLRYNPHKLLLDPYAQEIVGHYSWRDEHYGYQCGHPDGHLSFDRRDNAPWMLKARVAAPLPPLADHFPHTPLADSVLYEMHVKGFTKLHPGVPEALRGTYAGLAQPAAIDHLVRLGVTAVSLLPVHYAIDEARLSELGLVNYWGYNTLGFFAPDRRLSATP